MRKTAAQRVETNTLEPQRAETHPPRARAASPRPLARTTRTRNEPETDFPVGVSCRFFPHNLRYTDTTTLRVIRRFVGRVGQLRFESRCRDQLLILSVQIICWHQLLRLSVEITCRGQMLRLSVVIHCGYYRLRAAVEMSCGDDLLRLSVESSCCQLGLSVEISVMISCSGCQSR